MSALVPCSLTVIVTLLWSGIAKALDRSSTAQAIINLRLEKWIPIQLATKTVPWGEILLGVGLLLLPGIFGSAFALLAVLLFAFYWLVIMRAIVEGNRATCNCFGSRSSAPVSFFTLFRNTGLLLAAVGAFVSSLLTHRSTLGVLLNLDAEGWLWIFSAVIIAFVLWSIYRSETVVRSDEAASESPSYAPVATDSDEEQAEAYDENGELIEEDYERLPIPNAFLKTAEEHRYSLRQLAKLRARVLFHVSPTCSPCIKVLNQLPDWQDKLPMLAINPVVDSAEAVNMLHLPETMEVFIDDNTEFARNFGRGTPVAVALGADGLLAGGPVVGSGRVEEFMNDIMYEMGVLEEEH